MAKHGISILKLGTLLILFAVGALVGGAASSVFAPTAVAQEDEEEEAFCENDECDDGWFGGSCEENEDGATGCDKKSKTLWFDGCGTYVCGAEN